MSKTPSNLLVALLDQIAVIKITGRGNFISSVTFKTLVSELKARGFKNFILDLSECVTMDSTFLGVLAGNATKSVNGQPAPDDVCLELLNPNQRVTDLLENLGIAHLFKSIYGRCPAEAALVPTAQEEDSPTRQEISKTCLEAHQVLMALNPANIPKFKDVAQFLAEDAGKPQS